MGGLASGRRPGGGKATTSRRYALDVRHLQRGGWLQPGNRLQWQWRGKGGASIGIGIEEDRVTLSYTHRHRSGAQTEQDYPVRLARTPCTYGGERVWFLCPCCARRVAILYLGNPMFACRQCSRLAYASQRKSATDRAARRADKIRKRLGWPTGIANPIGCKPKGMHWQTYKRLTDELFEWQRIAFEGFSEQLDRVQAHMARITVGP